KVVYTVGRPCTVRPVGCQTPSSGSGVVNGCALGGGERWSGSLGAVTTGACSPCLAAAAFFLATASLPGAAGLGRPCFGVPPFGGGWCVYHQFSIPFRMPPPP